MTQAEKETEIKSALVGKQLKQVYYYLLNRPGYFYPNQPEQLVDTAVEFVFNDDSVFVFGMNFTCVALDSFTTPYEKTIRETNDEVPFIQLDVTTDAQWQKYIGETIESVNVVYNWFEDVDEVTHHIPQDIEINFSKQHYLLVCATAFALEEDGISILGPDSEGEVLVLFNQEDSAFFKRGKYSA